MPSIIIATHLKRPISKLTVLSILFFLTPLIDSNASAADTNQAWSGTWNNQKFKTTGPLTCTVVGEQNGQWIAKFTGTGVGRPFNVTALITRKDNGAGKTLQGTSKVEGDNYQWTGTISGQTMSGKFRSDSGNNGSFQLQSKK